MITSNKKRRKPKKSPELKIARIIILVLFVWVMIAYFSSCKPTERVVVKTEYINQLKYDSIYLQKYDSVYVAVKGDTVRIEKYKTLFKDRLKIVRDTVIKTDSLIFKTPPVQVKVPVEVNKWGFLDWVGLLTLIAGAVLLAVNLLTKPFLKFINSFNK